MKPIHVDFKPTITGSLVFMLMSVGSVSIVILAVSSWQIKWVLICMIMFSAVYAMLRNCLLLMPWSCVALKVNTKNQLKLIRKDGKQLDVYVLENTVVMPYLTVLNCQSKNASYIQSLLAAYDIPFSVVIFHDAIDAESFRQLRVYLRWAKLQNFTSLSADF